MSTFSLSWISIHLAVRISIRHHEWPSSKTLCQQITFDPVFSGDLFAFPNILIKTNNSILSMSEGITFLKIHLARSLQKCRAGTGQYISSPFFFENIMRQMLLGINPSEVSRLLLLVDQGWADGPHHCPSQWLTDHPNSVTDKLTAQECNVSSQSCRC